MGGALESESCIEGHEGAWWGIALTAITGDCNLLQIRGWWKFASWI